MHMLRLFFRLVQQQFLEKQPFKDLAFDLFRTSLDATLCPELHVLALNVGPEDHVRANNRYHAVHDGIIYNL